MTLEAIRLGVVPAADVGAYTVGRETELATVAADLSDADGKGGAADLLRVGADRPRLDFTIPEDLRVEARCRLISGAAIWRRGQGQAAVKGSISTWWAWAQRSAASPGEKSASG